jgi:hypothetical protein
MKKRGKILREPGIGPGLLMIEGRQYPFWPGDIWKSEVPPKMGLDVVVELDDSELIFSITAETDPRLIEEQAHRSRDMAKAAMAKILRKIAAQ